MIRCRADWVVPIAGPPLKRGWILIAGARIIAVGSDRSCPDAGEAIDEVDLGRVALMPGLVNSHTHLELSWLRGRIPAVASFPEWIAHIVRLRRETPDDLAVRVAATRAIDEAYRTGTALLGDIANTNAPIHALAGGPVAAVAFRELIGFNVGEEAAVDRVARAWAELSGLEANGRVRLGLAAHAPYSVSPALFRAIRTRLNHTTEVPSSVHLAESTDELEFLRTGRGAWRSLLEDLGVWDSTWQAPGCGPVDYLDRLGFLRPNLMVVHGLHLSARELETLAAWNVTLVTCPRGSLRTLAGAPPIERFIGSGIRLAIGTDSLGSVDDLEMFAELSTLRRLAPAVPASALLRAATVNGACGLRFERDYGTLEPGKRADCLAIDLSCDVEDVEEYLVGGIGSDQLHWVTDLLGDKGLIPEHRRHALDD